MKTAIIADHHRYDSVIRVGSHHIAADLLRRDWEVVWLPHPRSWLHGLKERLPPRVVDHEDGVREITLVSPAPYIGVPFLGSLAWGKRWLRGKAPRRLLREVGLERVDLLWLSDFTVLSVLDHLSAERVVFRFFDHIDEFHFMPASIFALVREYLPRADLVVASSRHLQERLRGEGVEARYLPNGADPDRLEAPLERVAGDTPKAVYVGALAEWFDLKTVEIWARALPAVRFELVGPNPLSLRSSLPNVHFPGPIPYGAIPQLLAGARVGIIPFQVTPLTLGVHPLKMYDYLAAGCPILCADLPEVAEDSRGVFKYRHPEEGLGCLRRILDGTFDPEALREIARANSWPKRLETIWPLLETT